MFDVHNRWHRENVSFIADVRIAIIEYMKFIVMMHRTIITI